MIQLNLVVMSWQLTNTKQSIITTGMHQNIVIEMQTNQFPFGSTTMTNPHYDETKKVFVRRRVEYSNQKQKFLLQNKLNILKKLYHRNIINVRTVEQIPSVGYYIYYNYVPFALEHAFQEIDYQTFKQLHRQIIHLAIHLAKNYILTSFNPNRCGVVYVDGQFIIKYYLPLNEIVITENISMLQRSVQLFKVQATHFLDALCHNDVLTDFNSSTSDEFVSRSKINVNHKSSVLTGAKNRKLSNPQAIKPHRRFSNTKSLKSLVSGTARKKSQDSTCYSEVKISGLKQTLKSLRLNSQRKRNWQKQKLEIKTRVELLRIRSRQALQIFKLYKLKSAEYAKLLKIVSAPAGSKKILM